MILVSTIVALVVILAGGGAWAYTALSGSNGSDPASAMPASVSVFAGLDVSGGNAASLNTLVGKFAPAGDVVLEIEQQAAAGLGLNYETDVKPWFGGKAGFGLWVRNSNDEVALLAFSSTNDSAARTAMAKLAQEQGTDEFGYAIVNGYVLVASDESGSGSQADADAAATAVASGSLADSSAYKSARSHLSGNNVLVAYADISGLAKVLPMLTRTDTSSLGGSGFTPATMLSLLKGTVIIGASTASDGIELRMHVEGMSSVTATSGTDAKAALDALPSDTLVGIAVRGVAPGSATAQQLAQLLPALSGSALSDDPEVAGALQQLADPLTKLLESKVISFALTGTGASSLGGEITADTQSASDAQSILNAVQQLSGGTPISGLNISTNGSQIQAIFGNPGSGRLSSSSLYAEATAGFSNDSLAAFVDVQHLLGAMPSDMSGEALVLAPIKAVALGASANGNGADLLLRVIIK